MLSIFTPKAVNYNTPGNRRALYNNGLSRQDAREALIDLSQRFGRKGYGLHIVQVVPESGVLCRLVRAGELPVLHVQDI